MKKYVPLTLVFVCFVWFLYGFVYFPLSMTKAIEPIVETCPVGSYEIDRDENNKPICKNEPTGCPYGENIPVDSPKCAPTKEEQAMQQAQPVEQVKPKKCE